MNAEQWREVKSVLQQAMQTPLAQRRAFVEAACADQPALQREVESLLASHDEEEASGDPLGSVMQAGLRTVGRPAGKRSDDTLRERLQAGLGDQFDVLGTLGSGGMGSVYLAHERALGRTVAIKVLRPELATTAGSRERFRREARIAAQLSNPGIVPLYSFGEVDGLWYFVMEYVRGLSLAQRLENEATLPADEVRRIVLAIAEALEHAHQRGVIHRDIKPANILLDDQSGQPRIADFGISKVEGSSDNLTATGTYIGTPLFMSPEQTDGATEVDGRSDVYSLGAVAYTMLTGRAPFEGVDAIHMLARRRIEDVTPILEIAPRLPLDLAHIVMRCLARDREIRWRDATALRNALRNSSSVLANELPELVADLPGYAAYAATWLVLWIAFAFGSARSPASRLLLILVALLVPVGPALHVWRIRAHGMKASQLLRMVSRPPRWWGTWWPARLRGAHDLWPRLPRIGRVIRVMVAAFFVLMVVVALSLDGATDTMRAVRNVSMALLGIGTPISIAFALRWGLRQRLGFDDTMQFLFFSTTPSSFWREPHIAQLLTPAAQIVRPPDPHVAADHARAVEELIRRFPSSIAPVGRIVQRAVQHQIAVISGLDREIALFTRDASPAEGHRLAAQLTMLTESDATSPDHRELGDTVRRHLELIRKIQGQQTLATARRSALFAQLRAVWSQLSALVEADQQGEQALQNGADRVRVLCGRILDERPEHLAMSGNTGEGAARRSD